MDKLHLTADLGFDNGKYYVGLSLVEFEEDNVTIIYSPALDLSGYGYSQSEAKQSFSEALQEFFRYTSNKKTLEKVLKDLGWVIKGSKKKSKFNPPKDSDLISLNPLYNEIVNNKSYKVSRENVEFAY
ncbi:hypothetical protein NBT05_05475 [Aquimarina sp. ERC-38]|uniref:hypothetical protein n=1 Tax=Aquimarina sp. ERC-38 TaxID=2949996 RepID=UPI00224858AB|nr:hypothetical protein [Aquimarina sp. ERC-38]UZO81915.1 hypothetical protein NBT05_05475 [Aquimarina sp. ERC-38]